jgi:dCTP deaminase
MRWLSRIRSWFQGGAILTDGAIIKAMNRGDIVIDPFDPDSLGTNSYDVHLGATLAKYAGHEPIDSASPRDVNYIDIPATGITIWPGEFYLGVTAEYTETHPPYVPWLDGKSSVGRLGLFVHVTAGRGDAGFKNHWTLEMASLVPLRVYPGMPIGQLTYFISTGRVINAYNKKPSAKYNGGKALYPKPMPSQMWKNFKKSA